MVSEHSPSDIRNGRRREWGRRKCAAFAVMRANIAAEPATVFEFFTDADLYSRWMGARAQLEPRPGGTYAVDISEKAAEEGRAFSDEWQKVLVGQSTVPVAMKAAKAAMDPLLR